MSRPLRFQSSTLMSVLAGALGLAALLSCGSSEFAGTGESLRSGDARAQDHDDDDDDEDDEGGVGQGGDDADPPVDGPADLPVSTGDGGPGITTSGDQATATSTDDGVGISTDQGRTVDVCEIPEGASQPSVALGGEDVPGNGLLGGPDSGHPGGSDFDDYSLTLSGPLLVDSVTGLDAKLGVLDPATISVAYRRGTTDCSHNFTFIYRRCPNRDSTELGREQMTIGGGETGAATLTIPAKNAFIDIVMTVTSGSGRRYGGCTLPFAVENHLYSNNLPAFIIP